MDGSMPDPFGTMSQPLTASPGEDESTLSLEVFLARTFPLLDREQESSKESDRDYGENSLASLARFDRSTSSWKTCQLLFIEDSTLFSRILPPSGMTRNGLLFARRMLARPISGNGSSSWATPQASDPTTGEIMTNWHFQTENPWPGIGLSRQSQVWPTPDAGGYGSTTGQNGERKPLLSSINKIWPTPNASDTGRNEDSARNRIASGHQDDLATRVALWPTPQSADGERASETMMRGNPTLLGAARGWNTPTTNDAHNVNLPDSLANRHSVVGNILRSGLPPPTTATAGPESSPTIPTSRRRLNPAFCGWLMGFPEGWTDSKPMETPWSRYRRRWRSVFSGSG